MSILVVGAGKDKVVIQWNGVDKMLQVTRAAERATLAIAEEIVSGAKRRVHRITGTLSRSTHTFEAEYVGQADEERAEAGEVIQGLSFVKAKNGGVEVLAGSLISYARYEERLHPFMEPAFDVAMAGAFAKFKMAMFQEGGLRV